MMNGGICYLVGTNRATHPLPQNSTLVVKVWHKNNFYFNVFRPPCLLPGMIAMMISIKYPVGLCRSMILISSFSILLGKDCLQNAYSMGRLRTCPGCPRHPPLLKLHTCSICIVHTVQSFRHTSSRRPVEPYVTLLVLDAVSWPRAILVTRHFGWTWSARGNDF